jgi:hypothetical protein
MVLDKQREEALLSSEESVLLLFVGEPGGL